VDSVQKMRSRCYDGKVTQIIHYPELIPPVGWKTAKMGTLVQYLPPEETADLPRVSIYVSPLIARHAGLPSPDRLIAKAIEAEVARRIQLTDFREPVPFFTDTGLSGLCVEISCVVLATKARERRQYMMFSDDLCYYGINYIAAPDVYLDHLAQMQTTARSIRPFKGRVIPGTEAAAVLQRQYSD